MDEAIPEKCAGLKAYKALKKGGKMAETKEAETASPDAGGVFQIAKQMDRTNQDVTGENCVCNSAG